MDWDNLVQRARKLAPRHAVKPNVIGILDHRKSVQDELENTDFCWLECDENTQAQRLREMYQKHAGVQYVQLYVKDTLVSDSDPIESFAKSHKGFAVFAAVNPMQAKPQPLISALRFGERSDSQMTQKRDDRNSASLPTRLHKCASGTISDAKQDYAKEEVPSLPLSTSPIPNDPTMNTAATFDPNSITRLSLAKNVKEDLAPLGQQIGRVIDFQDAGILEAGVAQSMQILENLKQTCSHHSALGMNTEVATWTKAMDRLLLQKEPKRTTIGVVGNTGAGKSSVINAILDEERLVPTNCMRACTAVVTEISWNSHPSISKYRAEIEFISPEDWEKEVSVLLQECLSGNGTLSREAQDPNSEAGVAWAKFRAVYPSVAKDELQESLIPALMSKTSVNSILGTTKWICMDQPEMFYDELQRYVDSKEKALTKDNKKSADKGKGSIPRPIPEMEYWPLIKVVKIYTNSPALSTGAVIVDLPGMQDSNAARAAVAQGYMKQCTGLWIVAPISRAVDDKAAKTLLGESFKQQLKYDGGLSNVTFICSKTDDISITEAIGSLSLESEVAELDDKQCNCDEQIEQALSRIAELRELQNIRKAIISDASNDIETWEALQEQLEEGKQVYAPITRPNKRKKGNANDKRPKKRQAIEDESDDEFFHISRQPSSSDNEVESEAEQVQLSGSDIKKKLKELKDTKKSAQLEGVEAQDAVCLLKTQIRKLETEKSRMKTEMSRICIAGRNLYSKSAIQRDFALGIKEMDQENAVEADEDNFNPEEELRDYDQVARSLHVFCVSSRAYQKLRGRMQKDDDVPGFATVEETEIPQLQDHCRKLTEAGRIQTSRVLLTEFCQLLIDLRLWTLDKNLSSKMTDRDTQQQLGFLERMLTNLRAGFDKIVHDCIEEVRSELKCRISDKLSELVNAAIEAAPETASSWGQKEQGGLMWASYRAVVRHGGVYHSLAAGHRDFNSELVEPIMKPLAPIWEQMFHTYLPGAITKSVDRFSKYPRQFHEAAEMRAQSIGIEHTILSVLGTKISNYERLFKDLDVCLIAQMNELQREANRVFAPCIASAMRTGYIACAAVHGIGSFKQMKERMTDHVELARGTMFHKLVHKVDKRLNNMCEKLQESMEIKIAEICGQMSADYIGCSHLKRRQFKEDNELGSAIYRVLRGVDAQFEPIANGDIRLVNGAAHIGVKGKGLNKDGRSKYSDIDGPPQVSVKNEDRENDDLDRTKLDKLKPRSRRLSPREET